MSMPMHSRRHFARMGSLRGGSSVRQVWMPDALSRAAGLRHHHCVARVGNGSYTREVATSPTTANLLRELRRKQGSSLRSAAADIGIAPSQLSRLERGQRGLAPEVSERLSHYYNVPAELISITGGEVPADVIRILQEHPEEIARLREQYGRPA